MNEHFAHGQSILQLIIKELTVTLLMLQLLQLNLTA